MNAKPNWGFNLTDKLHTDVLEEFYGEEISSEVLKHDEHVRIVKMNTAKTHQCATIAATILQPEHWNEDMKMINEEIKNGGLIGKCFRNHGYEIRKNVIDVFNFELPSHLQHVFGKKSLLAKARISEFYADKKEDEKRETILYGLVFEIYSPTFRPPELKAHDIDQINPPTSILLQHGFSLNDIFDHIIDLKTDHRVAEHATDITEQAHVYREKIKQTLFSVLHEQK